jgi:pimeloyl-ACP methyl ester carboxylesterase
VVVQPLAAQQDQAEYTRSVAAIARRQAVDDSIAAPGARSILLAGGAPIARAIVLLHGLTDSPRQFEAFAYLLHADGNNVYVPRLPQHGLRGSVFELPDSLRLPHNIIDPMSGRVGGDAVLDLLRELAYGVQPSALVRPVIIH